MRIKFRKDNELIKEFNIGVRLATMIFVFIIGSLLISTIALSSYGNRCKAMEASRKATLYQIQSAQELYFSDNNHYAANLDELIKAKLISENFVKDASMANTEMKNNASKSWYADVKFYSTEHRFPCADKVEEKVYYCDQNSCGYKN